MTILRYQFRSFRAVGKRLSRLIYYGNDIVTIGQRVQEEDLPFSDPVYDADYQESGKGEWQRRMTMDPFLWDDCVNVDELIGDNVTALVEKSRSITLGKTRQGTYFASGTLHSGVSYFATGYTMHEMTVRTLRAMEAKEKASAE